MIGEPNINFADIPLIPTYDMRNSRDDSLGFLTLNVEP